MEEKDFKIETNICGSCGRTIEYSNKREKNWSESKFCNEECRRNQNKFDYREAILASLSLLKPFVPVNSFAQSLSRIKSWSSTCAGMQSFWKIGRPTRYQGRPPTEPYVRISRIRLFKIGVYFTVWHTALMTHKVFSWRVESVELPPPIFSSRPNLLFPSDFFVTGNVSSILKPLDKSFATFRYFRPYRSNCSVPWVRQWLHFRLRGWCLFISTIRPVHSDSISSGSRLPVLPRWFLHLHLLNFKVVLISEHKLTSRFLGAR